MMKSREARPASGLLKDPGLKMNQHPAQKRTIEPEFADGLRRSLRESWVGRSTSMNSSSSLATPEKDRREKSVSVRKRWRRKTRKPMNFSNSLATPKKD